MFLLFSLVRCNEEFNLEKFHKTYHILSIEGNGLYDIEPHHFRPKVFFNQYRGNETRYIQFEPDHPTLGKFVGVSLPEANIFSVLTPHHAPDFDINYRIIDNDHLLIRGQKNGQFSITGILSSKEMSELTITHFNSDKVTLVRVTPEKELTKTQLLTKLMPGICILFFYGFGRRYRERFWKQFNKMNTVTLQRHINRATKEAK